MTPMFKVELRCDTPEFSEPMDEIEAILRDMLLRLRNQKPKWGGYYYGTIKDKAKNNVGYYKLCLELEETE